MEKRKANPKIVSAAVIERDGAVLIARRRRGKLHTGKWEFPGGTVEEGESPQECLKRELHEELGITVVVGDLLCDTQHSYSPDFTIRLLVFGVQVLSGTFDLNDHEEIRWVAPMDLMHYDFPEADRPVIEQLVGRVPAAPVASIPQI
jgi:8-oxo-dGTP diphosphatase